MSMKADYEKAKKQYSKGVVFMPLPEKENYTVTSLGTVSFFEDGMVVDIQEGGHAFVEKLGEWAKVITVPKREQSPSLTVNKRVNELKYIIVRHKRMNQFGNRAIVFDKMINHCDVVPPKDFVVHSAGFCSITPSQLFVKVKVWGNSTSLKVESQEGDDKTIEDTLNDMLPTYGIWKDE